MHAAHISHMMTLSEFRIPGGKESHSLEFTSILLEALQALSNKIHTHVASIKKTRNSLLHISKLPAELLHHVLHDALPHRGPHVKALEQMGSVCHWWHQVIVSTPAIWSNIQHEPPGCISKALRMSAPTPISVTFNVREDGMMSTDCLINLIHNAGRWRNVDLHLTWRSYKTLQQLAGYPASFLEVLSIKVDARQERSGHDSESRAAGMVSLFGGRADGLRVLRLDGITVPGNSSFLMHVEDLSLGDTPMKLGDLVTIIQCNTALRCLAIGGVLPDTQPPQAIWPPAVPIVRRNLEIINFGHNHSSPALYLFPHVIMPNCSSIAVQLGKQPSSGSLSPTAHQSLAHVSQHISSASFLHLKIVWIVQTGTDYKAFKIYGCLKPCGGYDLRVTLPGEYGSPEAWVRGVLEALGPALQSAEVAVEFCWDDCTRDFGHLGGLVRFLGRLPNVKTLTTRYGVAPEFMEFMGGPAEYWEGGGEGFTWLFPDVEDFIIEDHPRPGRKTDYTILLRMVQRRYGDKSGAPVSADNSGRSPKPWKRLQLPIMEAGENGLAADILRAVGFAPMLEKSA